MLCLIPSFFIYFWSNKIGLTDSALHDVTLHYVTLRYVTAAVNETYPELYIVYIQALKSQILITIAKVALNYIYVTIIYTSLRLTNSYRYYNYHCWLLTAASKNKAIVVDTLVWTPLSLNIPVDLRDLTAHFSEKPTRSVWNNGYLSSVLILSSPAQGLWNLLSRI